MKNLSRVLCGVLLLAFASAGFAANDKVLIGNYYAGALNGIAFINGKSADLLRLGWVEDGKYQSGNYRDSSSAIKRLAACAPDYSICKIVLKTGKTTINMDWGRVGSGVLGKVTADRKCRVAFQTAPSWADFPAIYNATDVRIQYLVTTTAQITDTITNWTAQFSVDPTFRVCTDSEEELKNSIARGESKLADKGMYAALVFDLLPNKPVYFSAGYDTLPDHRTAETVLYKAQNAYYAKRPTASGDWGDFLEPISNNLNNSRIYVPFLDRVTHIVSRNWCKPDGQVVFEWDSFFNGLLACLDDPAGARDTVRTILSAQQPSGYVPNYAYWDSPLNNAAWSHPPVGSMCIWKMHQRRPDMAFLKEVYPKLAKWHNWWFANNPGSGLPYRDGNKNGLLEWGCTTEEAQMAKYESGLDDSPMYDDVVIDKTSKTMKLDDVGLSAMWAMDADYLARIADALGKSKDAVRLRQQVQNMSKRINTLMWNEKLGIYCNRYWEPKADGEVLSTRISPTNFYPMIAGTPSKDQADRMIKMLKDPNWFWGDYVCPTIARNDPAFPTQNYWRGKIWAPTNYLMWLGIKNYAPDNVRNDFAKKSVALFMKNWLANGHCNENYLADGTGSSDPHYTWGALLNLVGLEAVCDIQPDGRVRLSVIHNESMIIRNIPLDGHLYDVEMNNGRTVVKTKSGCVMGNTGAGVPDLNMVTKLGGNALIHFPYYMDENDRSFVEKFVKRQSK